MAGFEPWYAEMIARYEPSSDNPNAALSSAILVGSAMIAQSLELVASKISELADVAEALQKLAEQSAKEG